MCSISLLIFSFLQTSINTRQSDSRSIDEIRRLEANTIASRKEIASTTRGEAAKNFEVHYHNPHFISCNYTWETFPITQIKLGICVKFDHITTGRSPVSHWAPFSGIQFRSRIRSCFRSVAAITANPDRLKGIIRTRITLFNHHAFLAFQIRQRAIIVKEINSSFSAPEHQSASTRESNHLPDIIDELPQPISDPQTMVVREPDEQEIVAVSEPQTKVVSEPND